MTMTHQDFLQHIFAKPDERDQLLIYADWLEEQGDNRSVKLRDNWHWLAKAEALPTKLPFFYWRRRPGKGFQNRHPRLASIALVRYTPIDNRRVWDFLTVLVCKQAVVAAELYDAELLSSELLLAYHSDALVRARPVQADRFVHVAAAETAYNNSTYALRWTKMAFPMGMGVSSWQDHLLHGDWFEKQRQER